MTPEQEDQLKRESEIAKLGQLVVNNQVFQDALAARRAQIFDVFCNTGKDQGDIREEAWRTMQNMNALQQYFEQVLTTGKMADDALSKEER